MFTNNNTKEWFKSKIKTMQASNTEADIRCHYEKALDALTYPENVKNESYVEENSGLELVTQIMWECVDLNRFFSLKEATLIESSNVREIYECAVQLVALMENNQKELEELEL